MTLTVDLKRISVQAVSPCRTVRAKATGTSGITVEFGLTGLNGHDEQTLETAVRTAVNGAITGYRKANAVVMERNEVTVSARDDKDQILKRRNRISEAVAELTVRESSRFGHVDAKMSGRDGFAVRIRPGTLNLLRRDEASMSAEINSAVTAVMRGYSKQLLSLRENGARDHG
ncbi:hypothetical protein [Stackebrandtia soli]|uniref:hypothetical protein n=1 Tax=Stackebrandtia soli TaxID=1892856 RepID=UPI0039EB3D66